MTHAATKVYAGQYTYRGYDIAKSETTWGDVMWFVSAPDWDTKELHLDPEFTLRDAKFAIDCALNNTQA